MKTKIQSLFGDDPTDLEKQNQALYNALAKMFLWQAGIDHLMPKDLQKEVIVLLGDRMVDAIVNSDEGESFEVVSHRQ